MRHQAAAQLIGDRTHQCDATATYTDPTTGARAYVLLDGIGSNALVQTWTRSAARRLARVAAIRASAEDGLRATAAVTAAENLRYDCDDVLPLACAVVAVTAPGGPLQIAWCGDCRAYLQPFGGPLRRLTRDHNMRQVLLDQEQEPSIDARNLVTSCLGRRPTPQIGTHTVQAPSGRLLLVSDGAYEPLEDSGIDLAAYLSGSPRTAAHALTAAAVAHTDDYADNASALVADLPRATP
ncbi:PP2C family protein-serine/threonine phosphatase [Nonomuraea sp. NPDC049646]|uniref:PP2C family protein-serine/threonine phosphatase n=1 Tax=unclassified Nonomuraea TaxID=2593643 RepID=UPI0037BE19F1